METNSKVIHGVFVYFVYVSINFTINFLLFIYLLFDFVLFFFGISLAFHWFALIIFNFICFPIFSFFSLFYICFAFKRKCWYIFFRLPKALRIIWVWVLIFISSKWLFSFSPFFDNLIFFCPRKKSDKNYRSLDKFILIWQNDKCVWCSRW